MIKRLSIILICFSIFLAGCPGVNDYTIDLPGELQLVRSNPQNIGISVPIGEKEFPATNIVPSKVVELDWDDTHLFAKQQLNEGEYRYWIIKIQDEEVTGPLGLGEFNSVIRGLNTEVNFKSLDYFDKIR
ncbi:DUF3997 domain-containing protein [Halalkalibacillus halophilus]|uniref:DUF3997 domain-containing protein n=1 Tax=Halalkalibacillus halophilus TaxID=392827 RepID=UPI000487B347|nr:DUF3997 domain-containing protein [Halalkalibacillus halophilus]